MQNMLILQSSRSRCMPSRRREGGGYTESTALEVARLHQEGQHTSIGEHLARDGRLRLRWLDCTKRDNTHKHWRTLSPRWKTALGVARLHQEGQHTSIGEHLARDGRLRLRWLDCTKRDNTHKHWRTLSPRWKTALEVARLHQEGQHTVSIGEHLARDGRLRLGWLDCTKRDNTQALENT